MRTSAMSETHPSGPAPPTTGEGASSVQGRLRSFLGVDYTHIKTGDGGDLYLTRFGVPLRNHLLPENWLEPEWFKAKRVRLPGTGTTYRLPTRPVNGTSVDLVVKWSRVGQDVPLETFVVNKFLNAEFNSPFEELSLLMELRDGERGPAGLRIRTQHPLAIYVPSKRLQLWQTGRVEHKISSKIQRHPGVELDILRQYVVLFRWVKGLDAVDTAQHLGLPVRKQETFLSHVTSVVIHELAEKGYRVIDMKPAHIILRLRSNGTILRDRHGQFSYALIDYELLGRTPEHERSVRRATRFFYLQQIRQSTGGEDPVPSLPVHLKSCNYLGVDYVFGHAESTGGALWVPGSHPDLFNYFLPERWRRTPRLELSSRNQVFYTRTKDGVSLVWRVSRMGEVPGDSPGDEISPARLQAARQHGFNSPFEEVAWAQELNRRGVKTVLPRAIYRTGRTHTRRLRIPDAQRLEKLSQLQAPDGTPALSLEHNYLTLWGFWRHGEECAPEEADPGLWAVDAEYALRHGRITKRELLRLMTAFGRKLAGCGFEDLNLKPDHLLLSFDQQRRLVRGDDCEPDVRLCNLSLIRPVPGTGSEGSGRV